MVASHSRLRSVHSNIDIVGLVVAQLNVSFGSIASVLLCAHYVRLSGNLGKADALALVHQPQTRERIEKAEACAEKPDDD
jgi:hypothetical protein